MLNEIIGIFFCIIGIVFFAHHIFHKLSSIAVPGGHDRMVPPDVDGGSHDGVKQRFGRAWNNHRSKLLLAAAAVFIIICLAAAFMPPPAPSGENVTRAFAYDLDGEPGEIVLTLNPAVYHYFREKGSIPVTTDESTSLIIGRVYGDPTQDQLLERLAGEISRVTSDEGTRARIAVSLAQHIPYDEMHDAPVIKYPYCTLYENTGVCADKAVLLANLLAKMNYTVALLQIEIPPAGDRLETKYHLAVGIRTDPPASPKYSANGIPYTFIETTAIVPISENPGEETFGMVTVQPIHEGSRILSIQKEIALLRSG
jgi:hypothetical protein